MKELGWFIFGLFILGIFWALTGGPERVENKNAPFLEQPTPIEGGRPYTLDQLKEGTRP